VDRREAAGALEREPNEAAAARLTDPAGRSRNTFRSGRKQRATKRGYPDSKRRNPMITPRATLSERLALLFGGGTLLAVLSAEVAFAGWLFMQNI
jgi:hypothetical protein